MAHNFKMLHGVRVAMTAEEIAEHTTSQETAQADGQANAWKENRQKEYPSIGDQLDYIYHNGVTKWKADMITPVKTKYPKE